MELCLANSLYGNSRNGAKGCLLEFCFFSKLYTQKLRDSHYISMGSSSSATGNFIAYFKFRNAFSHSNYFSRCTVAQSCRGFQFVHHHFISSRNALCFHHIEHLLHFLLAAFGFCHISFAGIGNGFTFSTGTDNGIEVTYHHLAFFEGREWYFQ